MSRRRPARLLLAGVVALLPAAVLATAGSTPAAAAGTLAVTLPATTTLTFSGTIPAGSAHPDSTCATVPSGVDPTTLAVTVPSGFYDNNVATFDIKITWKPSNPSGDETANDEVLTLLDSKGTEVASSDGSATTEQISASSLDGSYTIQACGYVNSTDQPYTGTVTVTSQPKTAVASLASAPAQGLSFSSSTAADYQRDEAEPNMEIDAAGNIYTCGPTGFSSFADYAQVSTDDGNQAHLMGSPPRGQQALGGGGDCGLATSPYKNSVGQYQYAYTGLGPLTGFACSTSPDTGHTLMANPMSETCATASGQGGGADRQWMAFTSPTRVLLAYNQQAPRNVVVQPSTNGGFSYGTGVVAAANPDFPGPMRTLPKELNPVDPTKVVAYFGWNAGSNVNLAVSFDEGNTWKDCVAAVAPGQPRAGFVTVDNDSAGNIYEAYAEESAYHTYMVALPHTSLANCNGASNVQPKNAPAAVGWTSPVQVDRDEVRTTVFPWLVAGGAPGRVGIAFYGTESDGNPNTGSFKASWNVYVNQSLNALDSNATFSQVKATSHPFHYDSICLNGLGCDLQQPNGDRSLADFFALDVSPTTGRMHLVYDAGQKMPDEASGHVAAPMLASQNGGPSNLGTGLTPNPSVPNYGPAQRNTTNDASGDALAQYSTLGASGVTPPTPVNEPAGDFTSVQAGPNDTGDLTVTMHLADLSAAKLQQAMTDTQSASLLWIFRFYNGFQPASATAVYDGSGFSYGFDPYTTNSAQCGSSGEKCEVYPASQAITGSVDQAAGTITMTVPRSKLKMLTGGTGPGERPNEAPATSAAVFWDASAFSAGNAAAANAAQSFLYPLDGTAGMNVPLSGSAPSAVVPEAPYAALLGLVAAVALGTAVLIRRRPAALG